MHALRTVLLAIILLNNAVASNLLTKSLQLLAKHISITRPPIRGQCLKHQCRFICLNGKSSSISEDIYAADQGTCDSIDELHLHNYEFPKNTIHTHLFGNISNLVKHVSIYSSHIEYIETGAFESRTLVELNLLNLHLINVHKGIFEKLSEKFTSFSLIQKHLAIEYVETSFLDQIKYQIKKLTIQAGLLTVRNLTNSGCLLNSLEEVNLSNNNFGNSLTSASFSQLSVVETLNLTYSEISSLPPSIFSDIIGTLKLLDLSHNKLTTISQDIFGLRQLKKNVVIKLDGNPWTCTCELQNEMVSILKYQVDDVYCEQPANNILVTSELLCFNVSCSNPAGYFARQECGGTSTSLPSFGSPTEIGKNTEPSLPSTDINYIADSTTDISGPVTLECRQSNNVLNNIPISWPHIQFYLTKLEGLKVQIELITTLNDAYGILYFSKMTSQFHEMINSKEYGLGCYNVVQYLTTTEDLLPGISYVFCIVLKDIPTVSPFSCKSVYIDGNLDIKYSAWLSYNMKPTGIGLFILGIVLFQFLGILLMFVLIRQKPTLIKGSKRVSMQKNDLKKIIVFPKNKVLPKFQLMEDQIAKRNTQSSTVRRSSTVSMASFMSAQSYMNANVYEIIPAYQPYLSTSANQTLSDVCYAEIPAKQKRTSNDPLPAIPDTSNLKTPILPLKKNYANNNRTTDNNYTYL